ncbi:hypothetical protein D3C87_1326630 [compost metagenome]
MGFTSKEVFPEKYFGIAAVLYGFKSACYIQVQGPGNEYDGQHYRKQEKNRLQGVSNDDCF